MRPRRFLVIGATGKTGLVPDDCVHLRTYLLAYDLARERLYDRRRTELLLAAGVLAETLIQGRVEEHDRRVRVLAPARADDDRTLRSALERIAIKPHGWSQWVRTLRTLAMSEVEATIAADGAALRNQGPRWRRLRIPVMTAHTDRVVEYQHRAREILTGQAPIDEIDRRDAAMTVIAAQGRIPAVASRRELRRHRERVDALGRRAAPDAPGLQRAWRGLRMTILAAQGGIGGS